MNPSLIPVNFDFLPENDDDEFIYVLCCPESGEVRYVGKAINVYSRYQQHIGVNDGSNKSQWIFELKSRGLRPALKIVEKTTKAISHAREQFWIDHFSALGALTNASVSGKRKVERVVVEQTAFPALPKRYGVKEFSEITELSVSTLRRWDRIGLLTANRSFTGRLVYTDKHLSQVSEIRGIA